MNAQRWLAVALIILVVVLIATGPVWVAQLKRDKPHPTPTSDDLVSSSDSQQTDNTDTSAVATAAVFPTQDPVITSLMSEVGIKELKVGDKPYIIMAGDFTSVDSLRKAAGTASIYKIGDITHALRLDPFDVTAGTDLHVLLSINSSPRTSSEALLPTHVDLGPLKSAKGAQNYDIPDQIVINRYKSIVIYSVSLNLIYGTATLAQVRG